MTAEQRQEQYRESSAPTEQRREEKHREESTTAEACEDEGTCESEAGGEASDAADHLSEIPDGSGCTEIWEHLSKEREDDD